MSTWVGFTCSILLLCLSEPVHCVSALKEGNFRSYWYFHRTLSLSLSLTEPSFSDISIFRIFALQPEMSQENDSNWKGWKSLIQGITWVKNFRISGDAIQSSTVSTVGPGHDLKHGRTKHADVDESKIITISYDFNSIFDSQHKLAGSASLRHSCRSTPTPVNPIIGLNHFVVCEPQICSCCNKYSRMLRFHQISINFLRLIDPDAGDTIVGCSATRLEEILKWLFCKNIWRYLYWNGVVKFWANCFEGVLVSSNHPRKVLKSSADTRGSSPFHAFSHFAIDPEGLILLCRVTISVRLSFLWARNLHFWNCCSCIEHSLTGLKSWGNKPASWWRPKTNPKSQTRNATATCSLHDRCDRAAKMKTLSYTPWTPPLWMVMNLQLVCSEEWIQSSFPCSRPLESFYCRLPCMKHLCSVQCSSAFIGFHPHSRIRWVNFGEK